MDNRCFLFWQNKSQKNILSFVFPHWKNKRLAVGIKRIRQNITNCVKKPALKKKNTGVNGVTIIENKVSTFYPYKKN